MCFVPLFVCMSPQCVLIQTCEAHVPTLLNRRLMTTSGIKFRDVNQRRCWHTNWDVLNIDLVTMSVFTDPVRVTGRNEGDDGDGDEHGLDSDLSNVHLFSAVRYILFLSINSVSVKGIRHC